jgi:hypothetical protein
MTFTNASRAFACAALLVSVDARADEAAARELFDRGRVLVEGKRCDLAIEAFRASLDAYMSVGAMLNLGDCQEKLGMTASAMQSFREVERLAPPPDTRGAEAKARRERLLATTPTVTVRLERPIAGARVTFDGKPLNLDEPLYVDAGLHEVVARAEGESVRVTRDVKAGAREAIVLPLREPQRSPAVDPGRVPAYVLGGAGTLGAIAGGVFLALGASKRSDAGDAPENRDLRGESEQFCEQFFAVGTAAMTASVVMLASAAILLFTPQPRRAASNR